MPRRAPTRALAVAVAIFATAAATPRARAAGSLQGTAEVGAGWTDNVFNAPSLPFPTGTPQACDPSTIPKHNYDPIDACQSGAPLPRYSDFFFELRPGLAFVTATPRAVQRLGYNFAADLFATKPQANSYTNTIDWAGLFLPSKRTELLLTLQSQQGRLNTLNLQTAANGTTVGVTGINAIGTTFFSQALNESMLFHINNHWELSQSLSFRAFIPLDPRTLPDTYTTGLDLSGERIFQIDAVGVDLRSEYVIYDQPASANVSGGRQHQLIETLLGRWRRDWSRFWSTEAAIGVLTAVSVSPPNTAVVPPQTEGQLGNVWQPYALAALRYFRDRGNGELRYEHGVVPNPLAGTSFLTDGVSLRVGLPFPEKWRLFFAGTVAFQYARSVGNVATGVAAIGTADASLTFQATTWLGVFARYDFLLQRGRVSDGVGMLPNIERNLVLVGLAAVYPVQAAARVPTRPSMRIDRTDSPLIPEPHSQPGPR